MIKQWNISENIRFHLDKNLNQSDNVWYLTANSTAAFIYIMLD